MSERHDRIRRIRRERRRQRRQQRSFKKSIRTIAGWLIGIIAAVILGYGFVAFGFRTVYMAGPSMEPVLHDGGEYRVNKLIYMISDPERYDIVVYRQLEDQGEYYSVKRVIGLPGETVLIQNGQVYINGNPVADCPIDEYIDTAGLAAESLTLGENEYFVMGDNVRNSEDSRYPEVGNIKKNEMIGRIRIR